MLGEALRLLELLTWVAYAWVLEWIGTGYGWYAPGSTMFALKQNDAGVASNDVNSDVKTCRSGLCITHGLCERYDSVPCWYPT